MGTPYTILYDGLIAKIKSYDFLKITQDEVYSVLQEYLRPALAKFKPYKLDVDSLDETGFGVELTINEVEILINLMFVEYLKSNYLNVPSLLSMSMPSKDIQAFSPANHLKEIMNLVKMYQHEVEQMISFYTWHDSELFINE